MLLVSLAAAALGSRLFTNPLYAGEPTSDEYFYGLYAIEVARALLSLSEHGVNELAAQSRFLGLLIGGLLTVVPLDPISLGRLLQATLNALAVPLVYGLARTIGLRPQAGFAAAVIFLVMPETWETAWRFWPDSQAAFLGLASVLAVLLLMRRPNLARAVLVPLLLALTFLTKEYVAAATLPAVVVAGVLGACLLLARRQPGRVGVVLAALIFVVLPVLVGGIALAADTRMPAALKATFLGGAVNRTLLSTERLLGQLPAMSERLPDYLAALDRQFGPREFGNGFVVFWAAGALALAVVVVMAIVRSRLPGASRSLAALWGLALAASAPTLILGWGLAWELTRSSLLASALAIVSMGAAVAGTIFATERNEPSGQREWLAHGLVVLGVFVSTFLVLRFFVWAAPDLRAAFTPRSFQPTFPVLALLAGWGVAATARSIALLAAAWFPRWRNLAGQAIFVALLGGTLVWLMPTQQHLASSNLLGRRADREGDLQTPGGLRITALVEAERWLQANVWPTDRVLTSMPRHLAWYARTGVDGYQNAVITGDLARNWPERRAKIMALLERPSEIDYVIDFNLDWTRPDSSDARYWYELYRWLKTRPYLEEVFSRRDPNGRIVFYAFRNHRWAMSPSYVDREEARAIELARRQ